MFVLFHDRVVNFMLPWKPKQGDKSNKLLFIFIKAKKTNYIAIKVTKLCILYNMKTSLLLFYRQQLKQNKNICIKINISILHSVPKTTYWNTVKSRKIQHSISSILYRKRKH